MSTSKATVYVKRDYVLMSTSLENVILSEQEASRLGTALLEAAQQLRERRCLLRVLAQRLHHPTLRRGSVFFEEH